MPEDCGLVFFDGVCSFCDGFIRWLLRADKRHRLRFSTLQGETAQALIPHLASEKKSIVLIWKGQAYVRSAALMQMLQILDMKVLKAFFRLLPAGMRDGAYDWFARNRYRLFGRKSHCTLPSLSERALFLS
ncbi:thiol-disulfide oxidoreductase DCC family protein [Oligoflexus tunisiensis]|uniref:thiol-disulfide oxidoreductase DCC family protein n=1 Tax=Oligoflexus tunisiensis TaxID=708132 RepID=UPI001C401B9B|nr:DCC1-like thiol-disulfide oxidoreductase family protein [Oligoflexus tunisiensis]